MRETKKKGRYMLERGEIDRKRERQTDGPKRETQALRAEERKHTQP